MGEVEPDDLAIERGVPLEVDGGRAGTRGPRERKAREPFRIDLLEGGGDSGYGGDRDVEVAAVQPDRRARTGELDGDVLRSAEPRLLRIDLHGNRVAHGLHVARELQERRRLAGRGICLLGRRGRRRLLRFGGGLRCGRRWFREGRARASGKDHGGGSEPDKDVGHRVGTVAVPQPKTGPKPIASSRNYGRTVRDCAREPFFVWEAVRPMEVP